MSDRADGEAYLRLIGVLVDAEHRRGEVQKRGTTDGSSIAMFCTKPNCKCGLPRRKRPTQGG